MTESSWNWVKVQLILSRKSIANFELKYCKYFSIFGYSDFDKKVTSKNNSIFQFFLGEIVSVGVSILKYRKNMIYFCHSSNSLLTLAQIINFKHPLECLFSNTEKTWFTFVICRFHCWHERKLLILNIQRYMVSRSMIYKTGNCKKTLFEKYC